MSGNENHGNDLPPDLKTALTMMPSEDAASKAPDAPPVTEVTMVDSAVPKAEESGKSPEITEMTLMQAVPPATADSEVNKTTPCQPRSGGSYGNLQPGDRIDRCVIVKKLGQGGMGSVYLARHETLGVFRAVKVLSGALYIRGGEFIRRFIQEAKIACSINHPNIVNVLDVGDDKERNFCYIIMEYVDGGTVRDVLRKTPRLSEVDALIIADAVAEALKAASEQKIVHRDIKPDNIMLTRRGEVKLADLGIARNTEENVQLTKSHVMMGTPAYLAPEQAQDAHSVDVRADIYSLGATLYEMLTGQTPYPGKTTYDILAKLVSEPVPDPRAVADTVSAPTARLVMRMLSKSAKQRPGSAVELLKEIRALHVIPADLDKEKSIRELLEQSGAGNYSGNMTTSTAGNPLSTWLMRHLLLKAEFFFRKLPLGSVWLDAMHRGGLVFYGSVAAAALILIGVPLSLYLSSSSSVPAESLPIQHVPAAATRTAEGVHPETTPAASEPVPPVSAAEPKPESKSVKVPAAVPESEPDPLRQRELQKQRQEQERQERERQEQLRKLRELREQERRKLERLEELERRRERELEKQRIAAAARKAKKNQAAVSARGIVVFAEIAPSGAEAVLYRENGMEVSRQTVPRDGRIQFKVPPGQYKLRVSASGFKPAERDFPVSDSRTISCVKIDLAREMTRCIMQFYGSGKLLNYLRTQGVELRLDHGSWKKIVQFPYECDLTRQPHRIEIRGKGIQPLDQKIRISPDQARIPLEFYLTEKEVSVEIITDLKEKLEINLYGIWEPLKKNISLQPFRTYTLKWRVAGEETEEEALIPELTPDSVHKIKLIRKKKTETPGQADYAEAEKLLKDGSSKAAVEKLKQADQAGHPEAAYLLGELAEQGKGRWFASDEDALTHYKRAASPPFNHPKAQQKLGIFHEQGRGGLDRNLKTALEWYKKAAAQKNPEALYRIGMAYKNGDGNEPVDHGKMMEFFTAAAELGHADAQYQTGYSYENGIGVPINVGLAKYWYQKAADQGHRNARSRGKALEDLQ